MTNHLDEGTIHAWLDGGGALAGDAARAREIEAHIAECATCSAAVAEAPARWLRKWRRVMPAGVENCIANCSGSENSLLLVLQNEFVAIQYGPKNICQRRSVRIAGALFLLGLARVLAFAFAHQQLIRDADFSLGRFTS